MPKTCSRPGCVERAVAQLTYVYALSRVEVSPVEPELLPGAYALCQAHLDRLKVPKGWEVTTRGTPVTASLTPAEAEALADEIRRAGGMGTTDAAEPEGTEHSLSSRANLVMLTTRAHLRVVADSSRFDRAPKG